MPLETDIRELTKAILELTKRLDDRHARGEDILASHRAVAGPAKTEVPAVSPRAVEEPQDSKPEDAPSAEDKQIGQKPDSVPAATSVHTDEAKPLDYKTDVRPKLLELNKAKGRDALQGLLNDFGVSVGDKLPVERLAEVLRVVETLMGAQ